ncbi:MAG TPA: tRNA (adenosine(37)-N6)-threonylcarbamoyltransferase complex dimerization subunit type 1 TsaB [Gemmatimonadales bacterium]
MSGRWLALDTATDLASVAVGVPPAAESLAVIAGARVHAAGLIELVDRCLAPLGLRPADLAGLVVGDGPGSFTGLRIGWAAAKGLAQERSMPVQVVPSLLAAAAGAAAVLGAVPVAVCFDALRGQVFGAVYIVHANRVETLVPPAVCALAELASRAPVRPRAVVGDGALKYAAEVETWSGTTPLPASALRPTAASLLALCFHSGAGRVLDDIATAEPDYGRPAEAQARWEARHGRTLPDPSRADG